MHQVQISFQFRSDCVGVSLKVHNTGPANLTGESMALAWRSVRTAYASIGLSEQRADRDLAEVVDACTPGITAEKTSFITYADLAFVPDPTQIEG